MIAGVADLFLICTALVLFVVGSLAAARGKYETRAVSFISAVVYVFALWIPAKLQSMNLIESKLTLPGILAVPDDREITDLSARWAIELLLILVAETIALAAIASQRRGDFKALAGLRHRKAAILLLVVGAVFTFALPAADLDDRAQGGQGLAVLLRTFLLVGLAYVAFHRCFGRLVYRFFLIFGIIFLVGTGVRSPLLVVGLALLLSEANGKLFKQPKRLLVAISGVGLFGVGAALISAVRGNYLRNTGVALDQIIASVLERPFLAIYGGGLDTLDGYRLSALVGPWVEDRPWDLASVLTTFIPRSIWPDKPNAIGSDVSSLYLGYEAGAQFMSPIGYFTLIFGSWPAALLAMAIFTFVFTQLSVATRGTFAAVIVVTVLVRFLIGGAAFDLYYGLTLGLPLGVAWVLAGIDIRRQGSPFPNAVSSRQKATL